MLIMLSDSHSSSNDSVNSSISPPLIRDTTGREITIELNPSFENVNQNA